MPQFNPLDHPICLAYPLRLTSSSWAAHIPFALYLVDVLRPRVMVELGASTGVSYCAFCQAVKELELDARCYALDTWRGNEQAGFYGPEILAELRAHHDPLYESFSCLMESAFDEALPQFAAGTIDLLHLDGYHSYESVRHDFESWLPKLSARGVVILHNINVRLPGFGVWKFWEEIKPLYPHFEFLHEHGLGLVVTGAQTPAGLRQLLAAPAAEAALFREFFHQLGQRLRVRLDEEQQRKLMSAKLERSQHQIRALSNQLAATSASLNNIINSRAWRWVNRYGRVKGLYLLPVYRLFRRAGKSEDLSAPAAVPAAPGTQDAARHD